ncbi:MAG TPA: hypothetical protein PKG54_10115 [Phycisphaerae bacterium]|jgi:predicted transcriptional regulator|nr:ribbon-helix-helix protein, CopG family [Phycisphaerae bacterium]HOB74870.1 hypothetical protein [Phycisphaerae bacterium]HOJ53732.1 hypothetical protein [Phycisphaerae bacterium]HOL27956.1 hypothetical protein [Phycisphaerae bacterium]HPP22208.1 hypothetical protein [Phycisphaerae bacterium]
MATTTTIRIGVETHEKLKQLATEMGVSFNAVIEGALEAYRRQKFLEGVNEDYAKLRQDPVKWAEELEERRLWETTLMDGLDEEY